MFSLMSLLALRNLFKYKIFEKLMVTWFSVKPNIAGQLLCGAPSSTLGYIYISWGGGNSISA